MTRKARPAKKSNGDGRTSTQKATQKLGSSDGNKNVLRSIVIKAQGDEQVNSQEIETENRWKGVNNIIEAPYPLLTLCMLRENSSELQQCIDAMVTNIDGFGYRLVENKMTDEEKKELIDEIKEEKSKIKSFLEYVNFDENLTKLRKSTRRNIEDCGNAYWELIPYVGKPGISCINRIKPHTMRLQNLDCDPITVELPFYNEYTKKIEKKIFKKKFRRFVQCVDNKKTYFKEWGDPRNISSIDGCVIPDEKLNEAKKKGILANSVYHFKIESDRTPYGIPRYVGNLFSIYGSRAADEINFITFQNNNIPSMLMMVSNGQMTQESIDRIQEFVDTRIKGSNNMSSFLILEAEPADDGALNPGTMKLEAKDLSQAQKEDQLFQNYDKNNSEKIRRCFRLPPIFVGKEESINRATAQESRKLADEQVFSPEREDFDIFMNKLLVSEFNMKYHIFKSNSANVTNDEDLVKILSSAEKTGGVTPNTAREILSDILNKELPNYDPEKVEFDPNVPLSYSLVKESKVTAGNSATGTLAPNQGQFPSGAEKELEKLENIADVLTKEIFTGYGDDE